MTALLVAATAFVGGAVPANDFRIVVRPTGPVRAGPYAFRGYASARAAFGAPTSRTVGDEQCVVSWRTPGVRITFIVFLEVSRAPCSDRGVRRGSFSEIRLYGSRWRTATGLRIGDSAARMRALYPSARPFVGMWGLVPTPDGFGPPYALTATIRRGRVAAFSMTLVFQLPG